MKQIIVSETQIRRAFKLLIDLQDYSASLCFRTLGGMEMHQPTTHKEKGKAQNDAFTDGFLYYFSYE